MPVLLRLSLLSLVALYPAQLLADANSRPSFNPYRTPSKREERLKTVREHREQALLRHKQSQDERMEKLNERRKQREEAGHHEDREPAKAETN